jgi:hypothetical protein
MQISRFDRLSNPIFLVIFVIVFVMTKQNNEGSFSSICVTNGEKDFSICSVTLEKCFARIKTPFQYILHKNQQVFIISTSGVGWMITINGLLRKNIFLSHAVLGRFCRAELNDSCN